MGWFDEYSWIAIPPMSANINIVLNWLQSRLDLSMLLPKGMPNASNGAIINRSSWEWNYQDAFDLYPDDDEWKGDLWIGSLINPVDIGGTINDIAPFAQHNVGNWQEDGLKTASMTIRTKLGLPWYSGDYTILVSDFSSKYDGWGWIGNQPNGLDVDNWDEFSFPIVRVWQNGKIVKTSLLDYNATDQACYDDGVNGDFWKAMTINGKNYTPSMDCGTAEWPRAEHTIFP
jgi:hypothetical protein